MVFKRIIKDFDMVTVSGLNADDKVVSLTIECSPTDLASLAKLNAGDKVPKEFATKYADEFIELSGANVWQARRNKTAK